MLVEKIVPMEESPMPRGAVAEALDALGIGTTAEALAFAVRNSQHQIADEPFAAIAATMAPSAFVDGLCDLGVEPIYISVAYARMIASGVEPRADVKAEIDLRTEAFITSVVGSL